VTGTASSRLQLPTKESFLETPTQPVTTQEKKADESKPKAAATAAAVKLTHLKFANHQKNKAHLFPRNCLTLIIKIK